VFVTFIDIMAFGVTRSVVTMRTRVAETVVISIRAGYELIATTIVVTTLVFIVATSQTRASVVLWAVGTVERAHGVHTLGHGVATTVIIFTFINILAVNTISRISGWAWSTSWLGVAFVAQAIDKRIATTMVVLTRINPVAVHSTVTKETWWARTARNSGRRQVGTLGQRIATTIVVVANMVLATGLACTSEAEWARITISRARSRIAASQSIATTIVS